MACGKKNSTLTSLVGDCPTIDIGCVPNTVGIPTKAPDEDKLPFAYDQLTDTLWFYVCKESIWVNISEQNICDLPSIDQEAVDAATLVQVTACVDDEDVLIPYIPEVTPTPPFDVCTDLEFIDTNVVENATIVTVAGCVDGAPGQFLYTGICQMNELDRAFTEFYQENDQLTIAGCADGSNEVQFNVNYLLPIVCNLPDVNQETVDNATSVTVAACVDDENVLIPYIPETKFQLCNLELIDANVVENATIVTVAGCVDGVPGQFLYNGICQMNLLDAAFTQSLQKSGDLTAAGCQSESGEVQYNLNDIIPIVCNLDSIDESEVDAAASVEVAGCVDDESVLLPYSNYRPLMVLPTEFFDESTDVTDWTFTGSPVLVTMNLTLIDLSVVDPNFPTEANWVQIKTMTSIDSDGANLAIVNTETMLAGTQDGLNVDVAMQITDTLEAQIGETHKTKSRNLDWVPINSNNQICVGINAHDEAGSVAETNMQIVGYAKSTPAAGYK